MGNRNIHCIQFLDHVPTGITWGGVFLVTHQIGVGKPPVCKNLGSLQGFFPTPGEDPSRKKTQLWGFFEMFIKKVGDRMQLPESFWGKFSCRIITLNLWKVNYSQIWKKPTNTLLLGWSLLLFCWGGGLGGASGKFPAWISTKRTWKSTSDPRLFPSLFVHSAAGGRAMCLETSVIVVVQQRDSCPKLTI